MGRIPVVDVQPVVRDGSLPPGQPPHPVKASVGEPFRVSATVFREGHDELGCEAVLVRPDGVRRRPHRMRPTRDPKQVDRYETWLQADAEGEYAYEVWAWSDPLGTWLHHAEVKVPAGVDVELVFTEGTLLVDRVLAAGGLNKAEQQVLASARTAMEDHALPVQARLEHALDPALAAVLAAHPLRELLTVEGPFGVRVERQRALYGSWYEFFPRSEGAVENADGTLTSGTFRTAVSGLERAAAMGFDVAYLPPIHPIGEVNRKGRNNTLDPGPEDVGSPWAIGSKDGGHDAVHPDLGTLEDFDAFVARARQLDLEVALDLALQAAPDHPWVTEHPEFFTTRADGTIAYAENPPKKYQDIYPVNFDNDPEGIYAEVLRVVHHWMDHGVRIFRVDNPHTKPLAFWERLLADVRRTDPDVVFLAEAFTKPPMMRGLGTVGYQQSYTYFTWRTTREELEDYLVEVSAETAHVMRPNFFVNTPDILHAFLQYGGPPAFKIRAVLAAMSSPAWGVYSGYELYEHVALRPGSEEYLDTEKFQIRVRDYDAAQAEGRSLAPYLTRLNAIRRAHPALQRLRSLTLHYPEDESVLCFSKQERAGDIDSDTVVVVVNLDPHGARETTVHLDVEALGLEIGETFSVHDELSGETWDWGGHDYVRLDPHDEPAHVLHVRRNR
ncbi:alpha-1,4-glucan:maltose-1-phosphate maltosyltransferase 2 [Marmoricola endophyticus]|uniref:Alpha-1,4-glucan:maltose-1-phosphate maltosyltransferase n=1 Tax=Marmoricola endophyticus TaxID=2040280 RepID=A0A917BFN0_9ACTN|nr:alpha-1,4-glucan:maltose-1-phosphate maltosyltransferase 2 [Marmoricola endophyticus]